MCAASGSARPVVRARWAGVLVLLPALLAAPAKADVLAESLLAMAGWKGTSTNIYTYKSTVLDVELDYAVFDIGDYPGSDPSGGNEYVYAYQIFSNNASTVSITAFSVGLADGSGAGNIGDDTSAFQPGVSGGVSHDLASIGSSSAHWGFGWSAGEEIPAGSNSTVLIFTSPNGPQWNSATVTDGGLPVPGGDLPSPVPEPGSLVLVLIGGALVLAKRRP